MRHGDASGDFLREGCVHKATPCSWSILETARRGISHDVGDQQTASQGLRKGLSQGKLDFQTWPRYSGNGFVARWSRAGKPHARVRALSKLPCARATTVLGLEHSRGTRAAAAPREC